MKATERGENRKRDRIGMKFAEGRMEETQGHDDEHRGKNEPRVTNFLSKTTDQFLLPFVSL